METICMFTPSAGGGMALYAQELMTAMVDHPRSRYRFEMVTDKELDPQFNVGPYTAQPILDPLRHRSTFRTRASWIASRLTHYPRRDWKFLRWLERRPDIVAVHFQEWTPYIAAPLFRRVRAMGKRVYYTCHNIRPHTYPKFVPKSVMDGWCRKGCQAADGLFVHTDRLADELSQYLGGQHPPIRVMPHGVWTVPPIENGPTLEERLSWKKLLLFGIIRRNKGIDLLLRAAEALPGYRITIAGEPQEREYYQTEVLPLVRKLQAAGMQVDLIDHFLPDSQVGSVFRAHSAIILPYTEKFVAQSGVIFLALAHDLPVVASEAGGLRDLFQQFRVGTTFREQTPQSLAAAVRALHETEDPARLVEQISSAKQRFSWREAAGATIAGYSPAREPGTQENDCAIQTTAAH